MNTKPKQTGKRFVTRLIGGSFALYALWDLLLLIIGTRAGGSVVNALFSGGGTASIIALAFLVVGIVSSAAGLFLAFIKKSTPLSVFGVLLADHAVLLAVNLSYGIYGTLGLILLILNLVLILLGGLYSVILRLRNPGRRSGKPAGSSRPTLFLLGAISLFLTLLLFIIPFCTFTDGSSLIPLSVIFGGSGHIAGLFVFALLFALVTADFILFLKTLEDASGQDRVLAGKMHRVIILSAVITGGYFVASAVYCTFFPNSVSPFPAGILPFLCMAGVSVRYSFLLRNLGQERSEKTGTASKNGLKLEFFLYGMLLSLITVGASLTDILKVTVMQPMEEVPILLNGLKVLIEPNSEEGFRAAAFLILAVLTLTAVLFLSSLLALIRKSELFHKITLASCLCSAASCMVLGLLGKYYEIVQKINEQTIVSRLEDFVGSVGSGVEYRVQSASFYFFLAAMAVVLILLIRRPYSRSLAEQNAPSSSAGASEKGETAGISGSSDPLSVDVESMPKKDLTEEPVQLVDPCPAFTELDRKAEQFARQAEDLSRTGFESLTLQRLVQFVVSYAGNSRLHLSYRPEDIAAFVAGLGATRLTILQGMSGTGKTSLPKIFAEAIFGNCEIIEVESSWRDKNELLGYYNEFSKTYTPKKFTQALYKAGLNPDQLTFIVLDEMNLSRIEYYFSDFLSLMENEEGRREIKLLNVGLSRAADDRRIPYLGLTDGHTLKIPPNVWFIGTANRDESTFEISDKVYDRAHTMNFNKRAPKVTSYQDPIPQRWISAEQFTELLREANRAGTFDIESCEVVGELEALLAPYNISFGNRVAGQIETFVRIYCACFPPSERVVSEAVETILLSKVVSKLEYRSVENKEQLATELRRLNLNRCSEFVMKLNVD